jgi:hypothetical protein
MTMSIRWGSMLASRQPSKLTRLATNRAAVTLLALSCSVAAVAQVQDIYRINDAQFGTSLQHRQLDLAPGKEFVMADLNGPGKVTYLYFTDSGFGSIYEGIVLKVFWDNASEPSIRVPLSDFFGALVSEFSTKSIDYQSLPMQINHFCHMSYMPMPFGKRARFVLENDGDSTYSHEVAYAIDYEKNSSYEHEVSRLHAAWNRSNPVVNGVHPLLEITGKGQYIGNFLQVKSNSEGWWGEGKTIFDIDGKAIVHTDSSEDEYGSSWGFERTFSSPYSGYIQTDDRMNRMYRWYLTNPVRFEKSLRVTIQNLRVSGQFPTVEEAVKHREPSDDDYTSVVFWYQEGAHPAPILLSYSERIAPSRRASHLDPK